jgi:hypothetical protein
LPQWYLHAACGASAADCRCCANPDHPEYEINYSERSPLVVPPNRDLPPPIATDRLPAPNWPQDPDLKKRQAASDKSIYRKAL